MELDVHVLQSEKTCPRVFSDWRKIRSRVTTDLKAVEPDGAKPRDLPHGS